MGEGSQCSQITRSLPEALRPSEMVNVSNLFCLILREQGLPASPPFTWHHWPVWTSPGVSSRVSSGPLPLMPSRAHFALVPLCLPSHPHPFSAPHHKPAFCFVKGDNNWVVKRQIFFSCLDSNLDLANCWVYGLWASYLSCLFLDFLISTMRVIGPFLVLLEGLNSVNPCCPLNNGSERQLWPWLAAWAPGPVWV